MMLFGLTTQTDSNITTPTAAAAAAAVSPRASICLLLLYRLQCVIDIFTNNQKKKTLLCAFVCVFMCQVRPSSLFASDGGHVGGCRDCHRVIHHDLLL